MMTKGKVHLLLPKFLPQLRSAPEPWTSKRAHVNDFSESRNVGSQLARWTSMVETTQVILARFMLERNTDPPFDDD